MPLKTIKGILLKSCCIVFIMCAQNYKQKATFGSRKNNIYRKYKESMRELQV